MGGLLQEGCIFFRLKCRKIFVNIYESKAVSAINYFCLYSTSTSIEEEKFVKKVFPQRFDASKGIRDQVKRSGIIHP